MFLSVGILILFILSSIPTLVLLIKMGRQDVGIFVFLFALLAMRELIRIVRNEQEVNVAVAEQDQLVRSFQDDPPVSDDVRRT